MGRSIAMLWQASFSIAAGVLYFFFVLPRWPELMGDTPHALGTALRLVAGVLIALAALPVVFTLLRTRKPEFGTPQLALTLRTWSIVAHVLAGVLIVGTAISEIWLSLDAAGQWLFGIYGAAAAVAVLALFAFYLSFVAELPPPPPKPLKPKKEKKRRRRRGRKAGEAEAGEEAEAPAEGVDTEETTEEEEPAEVTAEEATGEEEPAEVTAEEATPSAEEVTSNGAGAPAIDEEPAATSPTGGRLRNRRPTGKSSGSHRRRRSRGNVAVED
jgi:hypothetical protein